MFGVSTAGQIKARCVDRASGDGAGIWQSGAGLTSDASGTLPISTGNGGAPSTPAPGSSPPGDLGESVVRLAAQGDGSLKAVDSGAISRAALAAFEVRTGGPSRRAPRTPTERSIAS